MLQTDRSDAFAGFAFESDLLGSDFQDLGDALAEGGFVRLEFRSLGENDAIQIFDFPAGLANFFVRDRQHLGRIPPAVFLGRVRKQLADVSQTSAAQHRVGNRVQQHIGVAVPDGVMVVRQRQTAQYQRSARRQAMRVVSDSNS